MRKCLPALYLLAALAGRSAAAKPPDLPDNPPIVVAPIPNPPSAWLDTAPSIFPPAPPAQEYELTLTPEGQRLLSAALLLNAHPFLVFLPEEPAVAQGCPLQPADRRSVAEPALTRTVLENLEALEKATECIAQAEQHAKVGKLSEAVVALEEAQRLVPGSSCAQRAEEMLKAACAAVKRRPGGCEEAEVGVAADWVIPSFIQQFGMCPMSGLCQRVKECEKTACRGAGQEFSLCPSLARPITLHCANTPLGVVLHNLREVCGVNVVVDDARVCLQRPVCVHAERTPAGQVLEMVLRPIGYEACLCGDVVRVCAEKACCPKGCDECREEACCKEAAGPKMCGGSACPKCEKLHAKHETGVEEQVTGLMKACYLAIEQEQYEKAADLARQARALDPMRVEGEPVLYKFSILGECGAQKPCPMTCPGAARPSNNYPVRIGVGVNSDAGLTGGVVLNERTFDCCHGSVFTKVIRTHGWELAKLGADALASMCIAELIPDDSSQQCLTLNLSTSGVVNVYCRAAHEGTVYNVALKDGFFFIWAKPAADKKAE